MTLTSQIIWLFVLAIPVACIAWTVTHEEIFREAKEYCVKRSVHDKTLLGRKFFYLFTCEFCFSFYVTAFILVITEYKLLLMDWRGYFIAAFSLIWVANVYMNLFFLIRMDIKKIGTETKVEEQDLKKTS